MDFSTLEALKEQLPTEDAARKFLIEVRWGKWARCPFCDNEKSYFIENYKRFKCANKNCYKKFSVTVKSVLEASNISLEKWVCIFFLYGKSRGRISPFDLSEQAEITHKTEFFARERLDFIWKSVDPIGKPIEDVVRLMFKIACDAYEQFNVKKHSEYYKNPFHISDISDISDVRQYNQLLRYTKYYLNVYCDWIFIDFASPQDVLAETFLWMNEKGIKEYNADSIIKLIQSTASRMWVKYLNEHPKHNQLVGRKQKEYKRDARMSLSNTYILDVLMKRKGNVLTRKEMKQDRKLIEETKIKIIEHRKTISVVSDFNSHFK